MTDTDLITICLDASDRADVNLIAMSSDDHEFMVLIACEHGCQTLALNGWQRMQYEALNRMVQRSFTNWQDAEKCEDRMADDD